MVRVVDAGAAQGRAVRGADRVAVQDRRTQPLRPHHHAAQGRRFQAEYRLIDFKRDKEGIACRVERIEYDPNRTAHIALLCYVDGERRYIIAPKGAKVGDQLMAGRDAPIKAGNSLPLRNIPIGSTVHCIEMKPGKGAQMARSAGASAQLVAREGVTPRCACAPAKCARCRPTAARRSAKSATPNTTCEARQGRREALARHPADRSRRGDEPGRPPARWWRGRAGQGNPHPVSPWGTPAKGYKTRKNKRTKQFIVRDRRG